MRVAITGGTGMIGTAIADALRARGDAVQILTRKSPRAEHELQWDQQRGVHEPARLDGTDAILNLAGASIADRPWTRARRKVLWDSRVKITEALLSSLGGLEHPPTTFIGAGGLGIFGDRGDEPLHEDAHPGKGFLADLSVAWEGAHLSAADTLGCRASVVRMNIVLSATGGAFPLMLLPFRYGIGGWLGPGQQYTSWVSLRDVVGSFLWVLDHPELDGAFNCTVPEPVINKEWCKALGLALRRPVLTHAPKWALRGALGELADDIFLASIRALPTRLLNSGYTFLDTEIEATFRLLVEEITALRQARRR